jgi:hypothetical protein
MGYVATVLFSDLHGEIDARQNGSKNTKIRTQSHSSNIENTRDDHGKDIFEGTAAIFEGATVCEVISNDRQAVENVGEIVNSTNRK